jgi:nicotinate-nucleotide pyrophosphorylase (carboxylating)
VRRVADLGAPTKLEVSGGLTLADARIYAETGVDYLSAGALTHSAPALDLGLDLCD